MNTTAIAPIDSPIRSFRDLSCIVDGKWAPDRSGDYAADCATGRKIADQITASESPVTLVAVAREIVAAGVWDAVEIGLFSRAGIALFRD